MTRFERVMLSVLVVVIAISLYKPRVAVIIQDCKQQQHELETN